jgi:UDP-N-acetylmuramyl pentapeptide phosphotransferase/UDP-N-acetylglucosamine-1-phosphate transferase
VSTDRRTVATRLLLTAAGAVAVRLALSAVAGRGRRVSLHHHRPRACGPAPESVWQRTNYRGRTVSLVGGPSLAAAATVSAAAGAPSVVAALAAVTAGLGAGAVGLYDDLVGQRPRQRLAKGFHGHLAALRRGEVTSGVVKIVGVGAVGSAAAFLLDLRGPAGRRVPHVLLGAGVIAGSANLVNLLDLRPGRALKVGIMAGAPLAVGRTGGLAAGPVGACAGLLPSDLQERTMLGDGGANALGALLGVALAARCGPRGRAAALAVLVALTAASERVSFTRVIAATPVLREIDRWGRLPGPPPADGA